jgi:hypothetical protein
MVAFEFLVPIGENRERVLTDWKEERREGFAELRLNGSAVLLDIAFVEIDMTMSKARQGA